MYLLKTNKFRHLLSMSCALIIALAINNYYALSEYFLLPLTTMYVMQTSIGNSFYQGIHRFLLVISLVGFAALTIRAMPFFYQLMHDALIGAGIGMMANLIILPRRADVAFREPVILLIQKYNDYFIGTVDQLLQNGVPPPHNSILEADLIILPDWVYEPGFDSGLKKGYRFFLLKLEQIGDVLFAMHHLARHEFDRELIAKIRLPLLQGAEAVTQFFLSIVTVLELKTLPEKISDLEEEINQLDQQFHCIVPLSLELLDIHRDYIYLAEFVYYFKDLQKLLLKLAEALR